MNNKLFVASIPWDIEDQQLKEFFSQYGNVLTARIIKDRDTGRSKGFGFVEMASEEEAQRAIKQAHGSIFEGRKLIVNIAKPQTPRY